MTGHRPDSFELAMVWVPIIVVFSMIVAAPFVGWAMKRRRVRAARERGTIQMMRRIRSR